MSDDTNWISTVIGGIWTGIEANNDLKTRQEGGTGWRSQHGRGYNFKLSDQFYAWRDRKVNMAGFLPALTIIPTVAAGIFGASRSKIRQLGIRMEGKVLSRGLDEALKYAVLISDEIESHIVDMWSISGEATVEKFSLPEIRFEDFTVMKDNIWDIAVTFDIQVRRFITGGT